MAHAGAASVAEMLDHYNVEARVFGFLCARIGLISCPQTVSERQKGGVCLKLTWLYWDGTPGDVCVFGAQGAQAAIDTAAAEWTARREDMYMLGNDMQTQMYIQMTPQQLTQQQQMLAAASASWAQRRRLDAGHLLGGSRDAGAVRQPPPPAEAGAAAAPPVPPVDRHQARDGQSPMMPMNWGQMGQMTGYGYNPASMNMFSGMGYPGAMGMGGMPNLANYPGYTPHTNAGTQNLYGGYGNRRNHQKNHMDGASYGASYGASHDTYSYRVPHQNNNSQNQQNAGSNAYNQAYGSYSNYGGYDMSTGETTPFLSLSPPPSISDKFLSWDDYCHRIRDPPPPLMERIQQQLAMMQQQQQQAMEFLQKWQSRKRAPGEYMFEYADVVRLTWERLASGEDAEAMMQQAMIQQALSLPTHPSLIELERMEQQLAMMQQQQAMAMVQLQQQLQQQLAMMQHRQQAMAMMQQQQQAMMQQSAMTLWREQQQHSLARAVELLSCEAVFQESSAPAAGPQVGSIVTIISRVMGAPADRTPLHFSVGERLEIAQVMHWQNAWYATCTRYTTLWFPLSSTDWRDGGLQLGAEPLPLSPMIQHAAAAGHDATATAATLARPGSNEQASWAAVAARRPAQIPELDQEGRGALERGRAVRLAVQLRAQGPPRQGRQPEVRRHGGGQGQPPELLPGARTIPEPDEWVAAARRRRAAAGRNVPGHYATAAAAGDGHDATAAAESLHLALRPPCDGVDCMYPCALQTVSSLSTASRMELEMLLAKGGSPQYQLWDELYTVTYGNKIVACVFLKTFDLHELKARYHEPNRFFPLCRFCECCWSRPVAGPSGGGKVLHVGALTVSSEHRGQGIASRLLKLIKKKASKDRMLWIQLEVTWEEKEDSSASPSASNRSSASPSASRASSSSSSSSSPTSSSFSPTSSSSSMSELHRQHGFIDARGFIERLYDLKFSVLLALCMGLHPRLGQHSPLAALQDDVLQSICSRLTASELGDEGSPFAAACTKHIREGLRAYNIYTYGLPYETKGLLINDGDGQINFEKFVYDCISEERALLYFSHSRLLSGATGEVTWTGLFFPEWWPEVIENMYSWEYRQNMERDPDSDLDDLDRERDYREQQRERVSRKKIRTQARTQTRAHIGHSLTGKVCQQFSQIKGCASSRRFCRRYTAVLELKMSEVQSKLEAGNLGLKVEKELIKQMQVLMGDREAVRRCMVAPSAQRPPDSSLLP